MVIEPVLAVAGWHCDVTLGLGLLCVDPVVVSLVAVLGCEIAVSGLGIEGAIEMRLFD